MTDVQWDFAEAQAEFSPRTQTVHLCFDGTLASELDQLEAELDDAVEHDTAENAKALAARVLEAHERLQAKTRPFVVTAIGDRWRDLEDSNPPTDDQRDDGFRHNPDAFIPAALAACIVAPVVSVEQAAWMYEHLAYGQFRRIWNACLVLNVVGDDGVGKAPSDTARLLVSQPSSTTAPLKESPGASSLEAVS